MKEELREWVQLTQSQPPPKGEGGSGMGLKPAVRWISTLIARVMREGLEYHHDVVANAA